ncbi:hypothetical protein [Actinomadura violacea]|uniref:Uncharacterized protein n=1 Tax=Actinomadura violacea TaxID=2819934 RepID=A0ABS3RGV7_9ACTN|nr:hypothetical protein [Actinomadura violacea]MBO2455971.1 hypothetical protein [Actinomadura violacea]
MQCSKGHQMFQPGGSGSGSMWVCPTCGEVKQSFDEMPQTWSVFAERMIRLLLVG